MARLLCYNKPRKAILERLKHTLFPDKNHYPIGVDIWVPKRYYIYYFMIEKAKKKKLIEKFKEHVEDTGSTAVQIALLTERISYLTEHLKQHKKDFHSRRGLLILVGRRRRLISYLKSKDYQSYEEVAKELKIK